MGGDFNVYMNSKIDKLDTMSEKNANPEYRKEIISLIENFNLVDCCRSLHPEKKRYTWHARGKASRLDYCFISEHLLNENKCDILPGLHSDHSIVSVEIGCLDSTRGKGLWKFNSSLLQDQAYVNLIKLEAKA